MQYSAVITKKSHGKLGAIPRLTSMVGAAVAAAPVAAQEAPKPVNLPQVTVTGDSGFKAETSSSIKNPEPLRDTPRSITVIPQEVIQSTGSTTLTDVLRTVPGIAFGAGEGGNPVGDRPFIRGYDAQASTFLDGFRDIGAQSRELFNVESVEVTKGPAGAYDGRGSAGGSINITSKAPKLGNFAEGNIGVGNAQYVRGTADGNWQFADHAAFRLNAMFHDQDVAGRDAVHQKRWGVAPSVAFGLGTDTRLTLSYYHMQTDDMPDVGIPYNNPAFVARRDGLPRTRQMGDGSPVNVPRSTYYGLLDRDFRKDQADMGTIRFEHDFSPALKFRNQTRFSRTNQDYIYTQPDDSKGNIYYDLLWRRVNTRYSTARTVANQTDLSGEFLTGAIKHKYVFGVEFSQEKSENDSYNVATGNSACPTGAGAAGGYNCTTLLNPNPNDPWAGSIARANNPTNAKTNTASVYLFDSVELNKQWIVNGGVRLDSYRSSFTAARAANGSRAEYSRDDNLFNYQLGVVYKPVENASFYVSYGTSSTPAGAFLAQGSDPNGLAPDRSGNRGDQLAPEKNRSFELGTKWDVLKNRLALTAAIFRIETTNARIVQQDGTAAMAGNKRVDGFELGFSGNVTDKWALFGGYTHLKSELRNNGGAGAAFGLTDGQSFPNTPDDSFSLWTTYQLLPNLTIGGGAYYVSKIWGNEGTNKWVPSYWRFDAMAAYRINKNVALQLNVQNLTDKTYYSQAYTSHYATVAPGRTAVLNLNLRY
ncbi:putative TonB-dependent receptor BfrD [Cupriavidus taiwanensis]|uniref:TonB-dependent receptor BfrD n=2 Tax=Cupriavidus taiwanensis TaxID=164546 RepID=A0A375BXD7_9BURK|nr:putative TonB-dependent receptor BfrD [Cupriavidus taiwanensis]